MKIEMTREELLSLISYAASNKMIRMVEKRDASENDQEAELAIEHMFDRYTDALANPKPMQEFKEAVTDMAATLAKSKTS